MHGIQRPGMIDGLWSLLRRPRIKTRFAIISMGRSGSTFLVKLLDSHPDITCFNEVIRQDQGYGRTCGIELGDYLEQQIFKQSASASVGFKMPWDSLFVYPDIWGVFRLFEYRLVFLKRLNKLDQFISVKLAGENNLWWSDAVYPKQSVEVDPAEFEQFCIHAGHVEFYLDRMCSRFNTISVNYEALAAGGSHSELQQFLGVPVRELRPQTVRSRTLPRQLVVRNFAAQRAAFANSPWAPYFVEEWEIADVANTRSGLM